MGQNGLFMTININKLCLIVNTLLRFKKLVDIDLFEMCSKQKDNKQYIKLLRKQLTKQLNKVLNKS